MTTLYGIPNCDTVKKARNWLDEHNVDYQFHDFRKDGLSQSTIENWLEELAWDKVVNKRSTTWRSLSEETKSAMNSSLAVQEILKQTTLVKRPVLESGDILLIGFNEATWKEQL